jgi:hypothetical protein
MSVRAITWALDAKVGDAATKLLLVALADNANDHAGQCWPGVSYLAERCETSTRSIERRLATLRHKGLIATEPRSGRSSLITLLMPHPRQSDGGDPRQSVTPDNLSGTPDTAMAEQLRQQGGGQNRNRTKKEPVAAAVRAREPSAAVSPEAFELADAVALMCGHDLAFVPPQWCGAALQVQSWFNQGWTADVIKAAIGKKLGKLKPPNQVTSIKFFERCIADMVASLATPVPVVKPGEQQVINGGFNAQAARDFDPTDWRDRRDRGHAALANLKAAIRQRVDTRDGSDGAPVRVVSNPRRG